MTSLLKGARQLVSRGSDLGARVAGLESAIDHGRGRLDEDLLEDAGAVVERVSSRLRLSADHTVVALAGATGSGKSSTFNALTGLDISAVGVRRPTTSWATACVWGKEGATELLDWLGIPERHQVTRDSMLDTGQEETDLQGTVLLDLPDHDSTEVAHHLEVDRLVALADLMVWVLDPQKYADAAVHERYLRPLATHSEVMLVVLNHIDTVPEDRRDAMLADVRRVLALDGLADVPVLAISARLGWGVEELSAEIAKRVAAKKATKVRLAADLVNTAEQLREHSGTSAPSSLAKDRIAELYDAFADAAGVPTVVRAVEHSTRQRANRATGWPLVAWFSKLKPDPLKRLHLDLGAAAKQLTGNSRTSIPEPTQVQRARVDAAVRGVAADVSGNLTPVWQNAVRRASLSHIDRVNDRLDLALASTDLGVARLPWWVSVVRLLQWLLISAALFGSVWLMAAAGAAYLQLPSLAAPKVEGLPIPIPTLMLIGGVGLGVVLALLCRFVVALAARSRGRAADRRLRKGIHDVADDLVVEPIVAVLADYRAVLVGLSTALK